MDIAFKVHWSSFTISRSSDDLMTSSLLLGRKASPTLLSVNTRDSLEGPGLEPRMLENYSLKGRESRVKGEVKLGMLSTSHYFQSPGTSGKAVWLPSLINIRIGDPEPWPRASPVTLRSYI